MTFDTFYLTIYLPAHSRAWTRYLHFIGTSLVIVFGIVFLITGNWRWLIGMPVAGYGFAWTSHFAVEKNWPETLVDFPNHVAQSLLGNLTMFFSWCFGTLWFSLRKSQTIYQSKWL